MAQPQMLPCDGCGQLAAPDHFARRFARLELTTRYRPVHIRALLLGAVVPEKPSSFLYSSEGIFDGEAGFLLSALQTSRGGKSPDAILTEFQKRGLLLTHVLECPLDTKAAVGSLEKLIEAQLPSVLARIRRSLKPKRVIVISRELETVIGRLTESDFGCRVSQVDLNALLAEGEPAEAGLEAFRRALAATGVS